MKKVIISVLGKDRPGIIAAVTRVLFEKNCNIENVSQTILQTEFSGIFIISMPDDFTQDSLIDALKAGTSHMNMHFHVRDLEGLEDKTPSPNTESFIITTKGPDQKGLVARVTEILARYGVNVTDLQAVFKGGNDPGDNIMIYEVEIPEDIDQQSLRQDLRDKAKELMLDISIQHKRIFEAINRI
jgi:glycine cleavage system transcriptional repressor